MKVKTILVTVREERDGLPDVGRQLARNVRQLEDKGGKCFLSLFSSFPIVAYGLANLFSRSEVYYYEDRGDQRPLPPNDGPPPQ